jgi:DNA-binding XRE family transcriptional regulator
MGKRIGLKDRALVIALASQGLSVPEIVERTGITSGTVRHILKQGLRRCARCGRVTDRGDLCPVCSLSAWAPVGKRLKAFRTVADISQMTLALTIGVHMASIWKWESGRKRPAEHELRLLAKALGISVQELTGEGS